MVHTPSDATLWAIYTDLHGFATRRAEQESGQFFRDAIFQEFLKKRKIIDYTYDMCGHSLENIQHNPYLGVEIASDLNWKTHINNITTKANKSLGFIRRNLSNCPKNVKDQAYKSLVRFMVNSAPYEFGPYEFGPYL